MWWTMVQAIHRQRYGAILESSWAAAIKAFNRELATVNSELNGKVAELDRSNSDLQNLLDSTQIATIFLDRELRVKNFTPAVESLFGLASSDVARPLGDVAPRFARDALVEDSNEVLTTFSVRERDLR